MAKRHGPPPHVREHILSRPRQRVKDAAAALGLAPATVRHYRSYLIAEGALAPAYQRYDLDEIADAVQDGLIGRALAKRLVVSTDAIYSHLRNQGVRIDDLRAGQVYAGVEVARICGASLKRYSTHWLPAMVAAGLEVRTYRRPGRTGQTPRRTHWRITAAALSEFLARPDCPVRPEQITDPDWRQHAEDARAGRIGAVKPMTDREAKSYAAAD